MKKTIRFAILISSTFLLMNIPIVYAQQHSVEMKASLPSAYANIYRMKMANNGNIPQVGDICQPGEVAQFSNIIFQCNSTGLWGLIKGVFTENDASGSVFLTNPNNVDLSLVLGSDQKEFKLTLVNDGGIMAKGTVGSGRDLSTTGVGTRLLWYPKKAAFRVGSVTNTNNSAWDDANIGFYSSVAGGVSNIAKSSASFVGGGSNNVADGGVLFGIAPGQAAVVGGFGNQALGPMSFIGGGAYNRITGGMSTIAGGGGMTAQTGNIIEAYADYSVIGGGEQNFIGANPPSATTHNVIGGGFQNTAFGNSSTVAGGAQNTATGNASTVAGGVNNSATGTRTFIGGGLNNVATLDQAVVVGGDNNEASGQDAFVGSGSNNHATFGGATIVGGEQNHAAGQYAFIGAGSLNQADAIASSVLGGYQNEISSDAYYSSILGGNTNSIVGKQSSILNGGLNEVLSDNSTAAGYNVHVSGQNSFGFGNSIRVMGSNTFAIASFASLGDINFSNAFVVLSNKTAIGYNDPASFPANLPGKLTVWTNPSNTNAVAAYFKDLIQLEPRDAPPTTVGLGMIYVNSSGAFCFYNGSGWDNVGSKGSCN